MGVRKILATIKQRIDWVEKMVISVDERLGKAKVVMFVHKGLNKGYEGRL